MKTSALTFITSGILAIAVLAAGCKKTDAVNPGGSKPGNTNPGGNPNTGTHVVDPKFAGKWMWTQSGNEAYYDDNGVYNGAASGLACEYTINADGSGTCFNHIYSTIGTGTGLVVDITSTGFFESDNQGHLGYFPLSGTYESSSGTYRPLNASELWNVNTNTGNKFLYQKVVFSTQGNRQCFQVTSSDDITDTYFKVQ